MKRAFALPLVVLGIACGSTSPVIVAGKFTGTGSLIENGQTFESTVNMTLTQNGSSISGTWSSSLGPTGTVTGSLSGSTLTGTLSEANCTGTLGLTATVTESGKQLTGTYSGTTCNRAESTKFVVDRL